MGEFTERYMKKKVLYIIDDINYNSGAKLATILQIKKIQNSQDIYLLSLTRPEKMPVFLGKNHLLGEELWGVTELYATALKKVLSGKRYSIKDKGMRLFYTMALRCGFGDAFWEKIIKKRMSYELEKFDDIIVVSETSKMRMLVSDIKGPKKIQWIHTDYARWRVFSKWSRAVTKNDKEIYEKFDYIVTLSENCKKGMADVIPSLTEKIVVIPNIVDVDTIRILAKEICEVTIKEQSLNLVTVARIDFEKRIDYVLKIAEKMKQCNLDFQWYVIGDGPLKNALNKKKEDMNLNDSVYFLGYIENPYPIMARCDVLVLLSKYEGTPVTIDEAMALGLGVIAPCVGGILEQTEYYENTYLVDAEQLDIGRLIAMKEKKREPYDFNKKTELIVESIKAIL